MNVVLYSTGCPKCKILEAKLKTKNIEYSEITDSNTMLEMGLMSVPVLKVDGERMQFKQAVDWVNNYCAGE